MPVGLLAKLKILDGKQAEFEAAFVDFQNKVRAQESGNLFFHLHKSREDACHYVVMEQYIDDQAVDAHRNTEYYKTIPQTFSDFMAGPAEIQVLDSVP